MVSMTLGLLFVQKPMLLWPYVALEGHKGTKKCRVLRTKDICLCNMLGFFFVNCSLFSYNFLMFFFVFFFVFYNL